MTDAPPLRRRRRWPYVLAAAGVVLAIPVGLVLYVRWAADRELRAARAETAAADPGWQLADLLAARDATMPPADQNAALVLKAVERELPGQGWHSELDTVHWLSGEAVPNRLPTDAEAANLQAAVREIAGPLTAVRQTADLAGGRQPIPMPDPATFDFTKMPDPQWVRRAAYAATLDAAAAAARNDPPSAVQAVRAGCGVARAVGDEPSNLGSLVRIAVAAIAAKSCERVLAWCEPADGLDAVQDAFRREAAEPLARVGLRGERATFDLTMTNIAAGGPGGPAAGFGEHMGGRLGAYVTRPRWVADHVTGLRAFNRMLPADRPADARAALAAIEAESTGQSSGQNILTKLLLPAIDRCLSACQRHEATQLVAMTAVACERHRRQTGNWPAKLADISPTLLPGVPADPFDGQPLRYKKTTEGVVVYSLGEDKVDDGGRPLTKGEKGQTVGDVAFRLYHPAHRRKPAAPPAPADQP